MSICSLSSARLVASIAFLSFELGPNGLWLVDADSSTAGWNGAAALSAALLDLGALMARARIWEEEEEEGEEGPAAASREGEGEEGRSAMVAVVVVVGEAGETEYVGWRAREYDEAERRAKVFIYWEITVCA